jgi:hypothetical protein
MTNDRQLTTFIARKANNGTVLDLVERFIDICLYMPPNDRLAKALWIMHMHVYDQFDHTPRLALLSPAPGWGKSQGLKFIQQLVLGPKPQLLVDPTPAGLYQSIDAGITAVLIDEVDNLNLRSNGKLRIILNAFEKGTAIPRGGSQRRGAEKATPRLFNPFVPMAVAAIGRLPAPLTTRCVTIDMMKKPASELRVRVNTADPKFAEAVDLVYGQIKNWSSNIVLNQNPEMGQLSNRFADVWRVLIAIAESCGQDAKARNVAEAITSKYIDYDIGTHLLIDIRSIFDALGVNSIERLHLLTELHKLDRWNDWGRERLLSKNKLLATLRDYGVPPVHAVRVKGEVVQGWYRRDFEAAWRTVGM